MFEVKLVMAMRDIATLRAFLEERVKYTEYWEELNKSLVHIENMLDLLDICEGDLHRGEDDDPDEDAE